MPSLTRRAALPPPNGRVLLGLSTPTTDAGNPDATQVTFKNVIVDRP
jgi:hypothetical protein